MQVETEGRKKRPEGGTGDQERMEYARAWVRDAAGMGKRKSKDQSAEACGARGEQSCRRRASNRPDGRAQAADVAFGAMKAAELAAKGRERSWKSSWSRPGSAHLP